MGAPAGSSVVWPRPKEQSRSEGDRGRAERNHANIHATPEILVSGPSHPVNRREDSPFVRVPGATAATSALRDRATDAAHWATLPDTVPVKKFKWGTLHGLNSSPNRSLGSSSSDTETGTGNDSGKDENGYDGEYPDWDQKLKSANGILGSLKRNISFWKEAGAGETVLNILRFGYTIPFQFEPPIMEKRNNRSALEHSDFVTSEVGKLCANGFIEKVTEKPRVVNPLTVATNSSKSRLVLDLKNVNAFVKTQKFKIEDFRTLKPFLKRNGYMIRFDLKSGYHHVAMNPSQWKYLGFEWQGQYYVFTVLPFGLASAPYIFTKIMRVWVKKWRAIGIPFVLYIDDGIAVLESSEACVWASGVIQSDLLRAGLFTAGEKCVWCPTQVLVWIGLLINLLRFEVCIPDGRVSKALKAINRILYAGGRTSARGLASAVGQIVSMSVVYGPLTQLLTRFSFFDIMNRLAWDRPMILTMEAREELVFWAAHLQVEDRNRRDLEEQSREFSLRVFSDASATGGGASVEIEGIEEVCVIEWTEEQTRYGSTRRELLAVWLALQSFVPFLQNRTLQWNTDNKGVAAIIPKGSRKRELQETAKQIFHLCMHEGINLVVNWIPRGENERADFLSRIVDYDDWGVRVWFFEYVEKVLHCRHSVDRFANHNNTKCLRFFSCWWVPGTEGVNAFSADWAGEDNWVVPPIHLAARAIDHIVECNCYATLVVPEWKSQVFWTKLFSHGGSSPTQLVQVLFVSGKNVFQSGTQKASVFSERFRGRVMVARFEPA